jgi:hypothetical protein
MSVTPEHVHELMTQSLLAWRLIGSVHRTSDGAILVSCQEHNVRIEPTASDLPFRWIVIIDNRSRRAISLVAALRQVRAVLDPDYAMTLIAPFPLVPI